MSAHVIPLNPVAARARAAQIGESQRLLSRIVATEKVCASLVGQGFVLRGIRIVGGLRPEVEIAARADLPRMVAEDRACYYKRWGNGQEGTFTEGGVKVVWQEGAPCPV